jgi:hypothetical protein
MACALRAAIALTLDRHKFGVKHSASSLREVPPPEHARTPSSGPLELLCKNTSAVQVLVTKLPADTNVMHYPLAPERFYVPAATPQLTVSVAGLVGQCRAPGGCAYQASVDTTPVVTSLDYSGSRIRIAGFGFAPASASAAVAPVASDTASASANGTSMANAPLPSEQFPTVLLGDVHCQVAMASDTSVQCDLVSMPLPGENRLEVRAFGCRLPRSPVSALVVVDGTCVSCASSATCSDPIHRVVSMVIDISATVS